MGLFAGPIISPGNDPAQWFAVAIQRKQAVQGATQAESGAVSG